MGQASGVAEVWGFHISRQWANEGGKVVSRTHRPPLPPGNIAGTHFCYRLSRPQGHGAAGFNIMNERVTFRFVEQCVTPCSQVYRYQNYGETCCLHIQDRSFETFVLNYKNLTFSLPRRKQFSLNLTLMMDILRAVSHGWYGKPPSGLRKTPECEAAVLLTVMLDGITERRYLTFRNLASYIQDGRKIAL